MTATVEEKEIARREAHFESEWKRGYDIAMADKPRP